MDKAKKKKHTHTHNGMPSIESKNMKMKKRKERRNNNQPELYGKEALSNLKLHNGTLNRRHTFISTHQTRVKN